MCFYIMFRVNIHMFSAFFNDNSSFYYDFQSQTHINSSQLFMLLVDRILVFRLNVDRNISFTYILRPLLCFFINYVQINTHVVNDNPPLFHLAIIIPSCVMIDPNTHHTSYTSFQKLTLTNRKLIHYLFVIFFDK